MARTIRVKINGGVKGQTYQIKQRKAVPQSAKQPRKGGRLV